MSLSREELSEGVMKCLEDQGATGEQIERLIRSPDKVAMMLRYIDGDVELELKVVSKILPAERNELIHLPEVVSCGRTGVEIISALKAEHCVVGHEVKTASLGLVSTSGQKYHPVIIPGVYFKDEERILPCVDEVATDKLGLLVPPVELAYFLRKALSVEEVDKMGFKWLVVMHTVLRSGHNWGRMVLTKSNRYPSLQMISGSEKHRWRKEMGFVYLAPPQGE